MSSLWLYTVLVLIALIVGVIRIHNGIKARKNMVRRAWSDVLSYERQKNRLLPALEQMAETYKQFEGALLRQVAELRSALSRLGTEVDPAMLTEVERHSKTLMQGLRVSVEAYPDLKSADVVRDTMAQFSSVQEEVTAALTIFNRNIEQFNTGLEVFPNSLVNALITGERVIEPFHDSEASAGFEYQPKF